MEKRKEKRFIEQDDVLIKDDGLVLDAASDGVIYGFTRDISLTGARIISEQVFHVGCVWRMIIDLRRTNELLRVDGKVIWVKKSKNAQRFHIGVEFLHSYHDTIRLMIKHLYGRQGESPPLQSLCDEYESRSAEDR
jgi:Tfp pilus assembly protein PilZ